MGTFRILFEWPLLLNSSFLDAKASTRLTQIPWKCWKASRLVRIWRRNPFAWLLKIGIYTIIFNYCWCLQNLITYKNSIKDGWQMYVGGDKYWNQMMVWIISMLHVANDKSKETKSLNDIHRPISPQATFVLRSMYGVIKFQIHYLLKSKQWIYETTHHDQMNLLSGIRQYLLPIEKNKAS